MDFVTSFNRDIKGGNLVIIRLNNYLYESPFEVNRVAM